MDVTAHRRRRQRHRPAGDRQGGHPRGALKATAIAGSYAYARKELSAPTTELSASGWFNLQAHGSAGANVPLLRMFDGSGKRIVSLYRPNQTADEL